MCKQTELFEDYCAFSDSGISSADYLKENKCKHKKDRIIVYDSNGKKLEISTEADEHIDDWIHNFKIILKFITFVDDTIDEHLFTSEDLDIEDDSWWEQNRDWINSIDSSWSGSTENNKDDDNES